MDLTQARPPRTVGRRLIVRGALVLLGLLLALGLGPATAATYYVAPTGSDAHPGTEAQPWLTVGKAVSGPAGGLRPGDTVYFRAGTWSQQAWQGTWGAGSSWAAPITFAAYPGEHVRMVGGGVFLQGSALTGPRPQYLIWEGFEFDMQGQGGAFGLFELSHFKLRHLTIHNSGPHDCVIGDAHDVEMVGLNVHTCGAGFFHHGIYWNGGEDLVIRDSQIHDTSSFALHLWTDHPPASYNSFRTPMHRAKIVNNRIFNNGTGAVITWADGVEFAYNIFTNNTHGIQVASPYGRCVTNLRICQNVFTRHVGVGIDEGCSFDGRIHDNVFDQVGTPYQDTGLGSGGVHSGNVEQAGGRLPRATAACTVPEPPRPRPSPPPLLPLPAPTNLRVLRVTP